MDRIQQYKINISSPGLLCVCVDRKVDGNIGGRLYHCYNEEPFLFDDVVEVGLEAEKLFDEIGFPQASTVTRSFMENKQVGEKRGKEKIRMQQTLISYVGTKGTFLVDVRFRQKATWQGSVVCMETGEKLLFSSFLELIKIIDAQIDEERTE